jgi:hypothetical protein
MIYTMCTFFYTVLVSMVLATEAGRWPANRAFLPWAENRASKGFQMLTFRPMIPSSSPQMGLNSCMKNISTSKFSEQPDWSGCHVLLVLGAFGGIAAVRLPTHARIFAKPTLSYNQHNHRCMLH